MRTEHIETYELSPKDGRKSFYGKAHVKIYSDGSEVLQSYETDVIFRDASGCLFRLWPEWSATTGRHVKAFCGIGKAEYENLPFAKLNELTEIRVETA